MILRLLLSILLFGHCCYCQATSAGLVYYPPYNDPYADQNPCTQFLQWNLQEGTYRSPQPDARKECRGSFNNMPFIAPIPATDPPQEIIEDFAIDTNRYPNHNYNLQFRCKNSDGRVKSGLYFWVYLFRQQGVVKSYSFQTMMSWDTEGKMLFQPKESRQANISCRYYDSVKGYVTAIRTWRLTFTKTPAISPTVSSVEVFPCREGRPTLSSNVQVTVTVTSNRLEFSAFCPIVSCIENPTQEFIPVIYTPSNPSCQVASYDPASYPRCDMNPLDQKELSYACSSSSSSSGTVKIKIQSGARFTEDHNFKPRYLREDDRDVELQCYVDRETAPGSRPSWEFLSAASYNGQYQPIVTNLLTQEVDLTGGRHKMIMNVVKTEHEGSYRCKVPQSDQIVRGGQPIYGYYFVKVYGKPQCNPFDGSTNQPLHVSDNTVTIDLRLMSNAYITLSCSQTVVEECPNGGVCQPVVVLRKDSTICAMSNTTQNMCGGTQSIHASMQSVGILRVDVTLNNNGGADATVIESVRGAYNIEFLYPPPADLSLALPFTVNAAPVAASPTSDPIVVGDGSLWWIVLIVAGVILIVLILFVIGYCLRQSGQTYPVDKKERDAGHDPVKELKDAGFTDYSSQPNHGGSEPSLTGSVKVPEDSDSLGEYGEIDPTKFNEDGSFIHQYGPGHPASTVTPGPRANPSVPLQPQPASVPPAIPGPPSHHRPAPPPRPERSAASRQAMQHQYAPQSGGTNV